MVALFKSLQSVFTSVLTDIPDGLKIVTEFVWRIRWFLLAGWSIYLASQVIPYILVAWFVRSLLSIFF
jgi:hypothetical protein